MLMVAVLLPCFSARAGQVVYVSTTKGNTVHVYSVDSPTGALEPMQTLELEHGIGPLTLSPDETRLYGAVTGKQPGIQTYSRDLTTGRLQPLGFMPTRGFPTYLDVSPNGQFLVAAYYGDGVVSSYRITPRRDNVYGKAISVVFTAKNAHACLLNEDGFFFVPHTGPNALYQFRLDQTDGKLVPGDPKFVTAGPSREPERKPVQGPRHYTFHPSLDVVYVVNELDCSVSAYRFDPEKGTLGERFQDLETMPKGFPGKATCADIHVTPNGKFLYATTRGHDTIAAYGIDQSSGMMTPIGIFETEAWPREFEIDLTGNYLYAAGQNAAAVRAYRIDQSDGTLSVIGRYETSEKPSWVLATDVD